MSIARHIKGGQVILQYPWGYVVLSLTLASSVSSIGAFHFSQEAIPLLLKALNQEHPPTLIFTGNTISLFCRSFALARELTTVISLGATASLKAGARLAPFAAGKFALRALSQSLAREFGPKGIHVSHAIIDGIINIERSKNIKFNAPDAKLSPDSVRKK